jgi:hypothetical protein
MVRLTVTLIVAIYIILIVIPEPDHGENVDVTRNAGQNWLVALITDAETNAQTPRRTAPQARAVQGNPMDRLIETADGYVLQTADGEMLEITAVIDPVALLAEAQAGGSAIGSVTLAATADPVAEAPGAEALAPTAAIWRVAGDSVNFRAGPSTDTAILTALVRGDQVEYLADAPDEWAHLRVVASGLEGYMATRFLEPVN